MILFFFNDINLSCYCIYPFQFRRHTSSTVSCFYPKYLLGIYKLIEQHANIYILKFVQRIKSIEILSIVIPILLVAT